MRASHTPVLLERCLTLLEPALAEPGQGGRDAVHVDATLGLGGHAEAVLAAHARLVLVGFDRDPQALALAGRRLDRYADRTHLVHAGYDKLPAVLDGLGYERIDGALFDLGVSSMQLDEQERGFSYARDTPLDMRMDPTSGPTAEQVVNEYEPGQLTRVLRVYGEERFASRIVAAIVRERHRGRITSSARLAELVRQSVPAATRRTGGHPAKRTFQALRIEVNGELAALQSGLPAALDRLRPGGRAVVLSYHSLEDRIVKQAMAQRARSSAPPDLPVEPAGSAPSLRLLTRGAETAPEQEVAANPRASSVRLRAAERIDPAGGGGRGRNPAMGQPRLIARHGEREE
ncbi:MAG: 16S rRNA (cytosine(1402)-N(4))-methyltransferase RsmH [Micromonosporaceae bacterium]|nr:16S rRNA (cytosine(1402)-N(4))-methyltransferase RsmH [Micromonosporaceae bacterium]